MEEQDLIYKIKKYESFMVKLRSEFAKKNDN
jgi:hypothetical protein